MFVEEWAATGPSSALSQARVRREEEQEDNADDLYLSAHVDGADGAAGAVILPRVRAALQQQRLQHRAHEHQQRHCEAMHADRVVGALVAGTNGGPSGGAGTSGWWDGATMLVGSSACRIDAKTAQAQHRHNGAMVMRQLRVRGGMIMSTGTAIRA